MKRVLIVVALALALMAYAGIAQAEVYVSGYAGATIPHSSDIQFGQEIDFDPGFAVGGKVGYWFTEQNVPFVGVELDVMGGFPSTDEVNPGAAPFDVDVTGVSVMANALLRYPDGSIRPYGGAGVGWLHLDLDDGTVGGFPFTGGSDSAFAWQLLAGVDFDVSSNISLFVEYKYMLANLDIDVTVLGFPGTIDMDYRSSNVVGGITYHFH